MKNLLSIVFVLAAYFQPAGAQSYITYADINKADGARMDFEIIGKVGSNYLVYKDVNGRGRISAYNENMQLLQEPVINVLPPKDLLQDIYFFPQSDYVYMIYQYQEGNVFYCKAAKIEGNGSIQQQGVVLDTTMLGYTAKGKVYNIAASEDGSKLMLYKVNKRDPNLYRLSTRLFNSTLEEISNSSYALPMQDKRDYLGSFSLANNGDFAFIRYIRNSSGNITTASLLEKEAQSDSYTNRMMDINGLYLDDIKMKVDNRNSRYLVSSLYAADKQGNIQGVYVSGWAQGAGAAAFQNRAVFDDNLKKRAKSNETARSAFNNHFINSIIPMDNGGFSIATEALYASNYGAGWSRWNYWGPWGYTGWGGPWYGWGRWGWGYWSPYSFYSPFFYRAYWWGGMYDGWGGVNYNAGNIAIIAFDNNGNRTWDNVIVKQQSASQTDGTISYQVVEQHNNLHFVLNNPGKISSLEDVELNSAGQIRKNPAIDARDKHTDFMPKYARLIGRSELIMPYRYKNSVSFAKVRI